MLEVSEVGNCELFTADVLERWVDVLSMLIVNKKFAVVNLFSGIELCSNGCRTLNISQLLGPRVTDIRFFGLSGC